MPTTLCSVATKPSRSFSANSARLQCAVLAHNLTRWTATLGQPGPVDHLTVARTVRVRLLNVPGRLVNRAGVVTLRGAGGLAMDRVVQRPAGAPARRAARSGVVVPTAAGRTATETSTENHLSIAALVVRVRLASSPHA